MGNKSSIQKISFEDMQNIVQHKKKHYIIINTLDQAQQQCLIPNTIDIQQEEQIINKYLNKSISIVIYGKNSNDDKIFKKYEQLVGLGFSRVYIYTGGMFEWLLLQDIYGKEAFPTKGDELDILKFKSNSLLSNNLLEDGVID
jgi:hypothetical protein